VVRRISRQLPRQCHSLRVGLCNGLPPTHLLGGNRHRTLEKVKTEMSLQVLAYNMKRMINIFGVNPLMQAIAA
jgi:hypothetical protein